MSSFTITGRRTWDDPSLSPPASPTIAMVNSPAAPKRITSVGPGAIVINRSGPKPDCAASATTLAGTVTSAAAASGAAATSTRPSPPEIRHCPSRIRNRRDPAAASEALINSARRSNSAPPEGTSWLATTSTTGALQPRGLTRSRTVSYRGDQPASRVTARRSRTTCIDPDPTPRAGTDRSR